MRIICTCGNIIEAKDITFDMRFSKEICPGRCTCGKSFDLVISRRMYTNFGGTND